MNFLFWSLLVFVLMLLAGQRWRLSRRRDALNRALHEIRRPLQALALLPPVALAPGGPQLSPGRMGTARFRGSVTEPVLQAIAAVGDLDRELNGGPRASRRSEMIAARLMTDGCVRRWRSRAALSGARIALLWSGPDVLVRGDGVGLAAALENLIVNAIEHGGPEIEVSGRAVGGRVRIVVKDNGVDGRPAGRPDAPAETLARLTGKGRHGHGLAIAVRVAQEHGGRLETDFSRRGSEVTLLLPKASRSSGSTSAVRVNW
ncbi:MAG: sensor histidine kinase [Solirubrobacterales bacterium]